MLDALFELATNAPNANTQIAAAVAFMNRVEGPPRTMAEVAAQESPSAKPGGISVRFANGARLVDHNGCFSHEWRPPDLNEFLHALFSCALFLGSGITGLLLRGVLPERHRDHETTEFVKLVVGALVAFLAIVLGLLTASSKTHFDDVSEAYRHFGATIVELDHALRETGPRAAEVREEMRAYLAAVIASTWPQEPAPSGSYLRGLPSAQEESVQLSALLSRAETTLHDIQATPDPTGREAEALARFGEFVDARWRVIETGHPTLPALFYELMLFWTALVFLGFGLSAKRNAVVAVTVVICAVSLASVIYVILDLDSPLGGQIAVSSVPLRDALADLDRGS